MKISHMLATGRPAISFEFFPPKTTEGYRTLAESIAELKPLNPSFVSITYGAGGSTRQKTIELVSQIKKNLLIEAAAHLTCVGHTRDEIKGILQELGRNGIENIIALRGDPPKGKEKFEAVAGGFRYASELVSFIRSGFPFSLGVAGYPEKHVEATSLEDDLSHLKDKVDAGGDFIITQLFFNNADFFRFKERLTAKGIKAPVIAGLMPITNFDQIKRFTQLCGASIPDDLRKKLEAADGDEEKVAQVGIDHAVAQCRELLDKKVSGIHFYTLNRSRATREVFSTLKKEGRLS